ncbi:MAG: flagellar biosynthetic protein FliR [Planctomycetes bacterium]|nr:flagellar biosynthetic protein FliR [Planctomycetota bacterium]
MNPVEMSLLQFHSFVLVFFRVTAMMMVAPFFSSRTTPTQVTIGLSLILSAALFPAAVPDPVPLQGLGQFAVAAGLETAVGLLFGLTATFLFGAASLAGALIDNELGLGLANILDPITNDQVSLVGQFKFLFATLLFLVLDGHHFLLTALGNSFHEVPLLGFSFSNTLGTYVADTLFTDLLVSAVKFAAPALAAMFLVTVALALVARAVPEMNLFIHGFSVRIGLGLAVLAVSIPAFAYAFAKLWGKAQGSLNRLLELMA